MQKTIAAILSKLHAPQQPMMQGYVIGLTTLNKSDCFNKPPAKLKIVIFQVLGYRYKKKGLP